MLNTSAVISTLVSFAVGIMSYSLLRSSIRYQRFFESRALLLAAPLDPGMTSPVAEILSVTVRRLVALTVFIVGPRLLDALIRWMIPERFPVAYQAAVEGGIASIDLSDQQAWIWIVGVGVMVLIYYLFRRVHATPDPDLYTDPPVIEWPWWALIANLLGILAYAVSVEWILRGTLYALLLPAGVELSIATGAVLYGLSRLPDGAAPAWGGLVLSIFAGMLVLGSGSLLPVFMGHALLGTSQFFLTIHRNPTVSIMNHV
ncbi:MAG: hypothetical protein ACLFNQ_09670 [Spirochaetaceae bacterium]